ncbi:hypothetical protein NE865_16298 [Phthorimaea operculella]|nr:hypothetical protein NE865_16298 [Phthorimaea operculella]
MPYGKERKFLSKQLDEQVLIESPFQETTRDGLDLGSVLLALTSSQLVLIIRKKLNLNPGIYYNRIDAQYHLNDVQLSIFKQTRRQVLKACFYNKTVKYFELGLCKKRKIFWKLWCDHVRELKSEHKRWPFQTLKEVYNYHAHVISNITADYSYTLSKPSTDLLHDEDLVKSESRATRKRWTDKYVYLGSKREEEDREKPVPIEPECPEGVKLFYLQSDLAGCWDEGDHWMQCGDSARESTRVDSHISTYTGQPTTKVTYTSLITAWK